MGYLKARALETKRFDPFDVAIVDLLVEQLILGLLRPHQNHSNPRSPNPQITPR